MRRERSRASEASRGGAKRSGDPGYKHKPSRGGAKRSGDPGHQHKPSRGGAKRSGDPGHQRKPISWAPGLFACLALLVGCGASTQRGLITTAVANDGERATAFEATAQTLDEHPAWIDEFYRVARRHPAHLRRFQADTARDLRDPELATETGELLAENPPSLEQTLIATLDASKGRAPARAAIDAAIVARAGTMADVIADAPRAVTAITDATVAAVEPRPPAKAAFLGSLRTSSPRLAVMLKQDPDTAKTLLGALARQYDPPQLAELLQTLGFVK
jgi:hypothetical protein